MATVASRLLRAARNASLASRTAAAAASRAAAVASRSARAAAAAVAAARAARLGSGVGHASTKPHEDALRRPWGYSDYEHLPDDATTPTDKDLESDEAVWAFYERWCKAFNKQRDHTEMVRRFKIFRHHARYVHDWNTYVPEDPKEAKKKRKAALLVSKGKDVSNFDERHLPMGLGRFADGGDPLDEYCKLLLKNIEEMDRVSAVEDVIAE